VAHGALVASSPAPRATFAAGARPSSVTLRFSDHVAPDAARIRVLGPDGSRLDRGPVRATRDGAISVRVAGGAPAGRYTVGWRAVSHDGHATTGGFAFSVGVARGAARAGRASLPGATARAFDPAALPGTPAATARAFDIARSTQYAALALAFGTMLFGILTWRRMEAPPALRRRFARRSRQLLLGGLVVGAISAAAALLCQAATQAGAQPWSAAAFGALGDAIRGGGAGCAWAVVLGGWLLALALWARRPDSVPAVVVVGALVVSPALCGHAAGSPLAPAVALHVTAMAAWSGGLVALLVLWHCVARELAADARLPLLAANVDRFSRLALPAVTLVFATGALQALARLNAADDLLHTGYGRLVLCKMLLFATLIALAARGRLRLAPRLRAAARGTALDASRALRGAVAAEVAIVLVVLTATGALAGTAPPG